MRKGRGSCVEPSSLKNFGSMFDAEAIHAQIPSNIEPNYHLLPGGVFGRSRRHSNRDCLAARTRNRAISAALIFSSHCLKPPLFRHRTKKCLNRCEEAVVMRKSVEP